MYVVIVKNYNTLNGIIHLAELCRDEKFSKSFSAVFTDKKYLQQDTSVWILKQVTG